MTRFYKVLIVLIFLVASTGLTGKEPAGVIAIQPFGNIKKAIIAEVQKGITGAFRVRVEVLERVPLPKEAWYPPRRRWRAERLLSFLSRNTPSRYMKVIGLTNRDISTSKGKFKDWGIFGLGTVGGRTCVVSTFRLRRSRVSYRYFIGRLVKVANHELGHTFGLGHCPNRGCLMEDAKGTIRTVDRETGAFCEECQKRLRHVLR